MITKENLLQLFDEMQITCFEVVDWTKDRLFIHRGKTVADAKEKLIASLEYFPGKITINAFKTENFKGGFTWTIKQEDKLTNQRDATISGIGEIQKINEERLKLAEERKEWEWQKKFDELEKRLKGDETGMAGIEKILNHPVTEKVLGALFPEKENQHLKIAGTPEELNAAEQEVSKLLQSIEKKIGLPTLLKLLRGLEAKPELASMALKFI